MNLFEKEIRGRAVNPIGIGTWGMGGARFSDRELFADYDHDEREIAAIRYSLDKGQDHIDTAELYGVGHTEEIVGKAIKPYPRDAFFLASKVWEWHALRTAVPKAVEGMLSRLGTDFLDLFYVHFPWEAVPMEEYMGGANDVIDSGMAKHLAVSNFTLEQLKKAVSISKHPITAVQVHYSILERTVVTPEYLTFCRENGMAVIAYRPLERKELADRNKSRELARIAATYNRPIHHIALNWLLCQEGVIPIPKASSPEHIDSNLESLEFRLEDEDIAVLDKMARAVT
jgi:diketogulonate reductase-like aldo/keto reductase